MSTRFGYKVLKDLSLTTKNFEWSKSGGSEYVDITVIDKRVNKNYDRDAFSLDQFFVPALYSDYLRTRSSVNSYEYISKKGKISKVVLPITEDCVYVPGNESTPYQVRFKNIQIGWFCDRFDYFKLFQITGGRYVNSFSQLKGKVLNKFNKEIKLELLTSEMRKSVYGISGCGILLCDIHPGDPACKFLLGFRNNEYHIPGGTISDQSFFMTDTMNVAIQEFAEEVGLYVRISQVVVTLINNGFVTYVCVGSALGDSGSISDDKFESVTSRDYKKWFVDINKFTQRTYEVFTVLFAKQSTSIDPNVGLIEITDSTVHVNDNPPPSKRGKESFLRKNQKYRIKTESSESKVSFDTVVKDELPIEIKSEIPSGDVVTEAPILVENPKSNIIEDPGLGFTFSEDTFNNFDDGQGEDYEDITQEEAVSISKWEWRDYLEEGLDEDLGEAFYNAGWEVDQIDDFIFMFYHQEDDDTNSLYIESDGFVVNGQTLGREQVISQIYQQIT